MKTILSKIPRIAELTPSFTVREMIVLSLLLTIGAFFFVQSFRSYADSFDDVLDNIFNLSQTHNHLNQQYITQAYQNTPRATPPPIELKKLISDYQNLSQKIKRLPNLDDQTFITHALYSKFISPYDFEIHRILAEHEYILHIKSYKEISDFNFQDSLSTLYTLIREKHKSYIYLTNNYRAATYITIFLLIIYNSYIFISHYSKERSHAILSNNAKTDFLANMSHEIRTPLNGIIGMSDLIRSSPLTDEQNKYFKALVSSAENLNELINDILDITKIEAGHIELEIVPFDLNDILDPLIASFELRAKTKRLRILKEIHPDLHMTYMGDPTRLRQILTNLIGNALKFTETGHIKILVSENPQTPGEIYFEVEDTGIGIPENKRQYIFQKFSQADTSTTRKYGGTGLGLVITKNLVMLMGGRIDFKSNQFEGTTFWFSLPLLKASQESITTQNILIPVDVQSIEGKKILLVEDNIVNQQYALKILHDMKLNTTLAETGISAVQYFRTHAAEIDLILMDCRMPEMDGYEATQLIREMENSKDTSQRIPIIALTANAIKGDIEKCMACGMDDYLTKPIHRRTLETTIYNWLVSSDGKNKSSREKDSEQSDNHNDCEHKEEAHPKIAIIDMDIYNEISMMMGEDTPQLVDHYIQSISTYIEKMRFGLEIKNYQEIADAAHPLKSSSGSFGAIEMQKLSARIEMAAIKLDPDTEIQTLITQITDLSEQTIQALKELQNDTTQKNSAY